MSIDDILDLFSFTMKADQSVREGLLGELCKTAPTTQLDIQRDLYLLSCVENMSTLVLTSLESLEKDYNLPEVSFVIRNIVSDWHVELRKAKSRIKPGSIRKYRKDTGVTVPPEGVVDSYYVFKHALRKALFLTEKYLDGLVSYQEALDGYHKAQMVYEALKQRNIRIATDDYHNYLWLRNRYDNTYP